MPQIKLYKLILNNFRSFYGYHEFVLPENGLVLIDGINHDSSGGSGSGKSSFFYAVSYALGHCPYSAKELSSWNSEDSMYVELHFKVDNEMVLLHRGDKFWLQLPNERVEGSAKITEQALDKFLGLNSKLREALTYRPQNKPGLFLSMKDGDKKDFLTDILQLHWIEQGISQSDLLIKSLGPKVENAENEFKAQEEVHNAASLAIRTVPKLKDISEFETQERLFAHQIVNLEVTIALLKSQLDSENSKINNKIKDLQQEYSQTIDGIKQSIYPQDILNKCKKLLIEFQQRLSKEKSENKKAEMAINNKEREITKLESQYNTLEQNLCPTCGQTYLKSLDLLRQYKEKVTVLKEEQVNLSQTIQVDKILKLEVGQKTLIELIAKEDQNLKNHQTTIENQIAVLQGRFAEARLTAQSDPIMYELSSKLNNFNNDLSSLKNSLLKLTNEYNVIKVENQKIQSTTEERQRYLSETENKLNTRQTDLLNLQESHKIEQDYRDMLKGFLNNIFDEILDEISSETNTILNNLPNVSHLTIQFDSEKQTLKGTTKSTITPVVCFNGESHPLESGCSGGMFTSVELAVDLALAKVVKRRTGTDLGWIILDECFNGHDSITKEACLEVLKSYAEDRTVFIVDHASETKEMFTQVIEITYKNGTSKAA